ncbi:MAG: hypothetical protein CMO01_07285 [Thalassobius sp.]|nr:hypothetical protein [Thalassovita sp.]
MNKYILCLILLLSLSKLMAQNTLELKVKDDETKESLIGVSVYIPTIKKGSVTDQNGLALIKNIPDGEYKVQVSYVGYEKQQFSYIFSLDKTTHTIEVFLSVSEEEMEEVVITSTRSSRTIEDLPTRVEFIAGEELSEKGNMKPGDIRMLLNESTGIQTQQTSATSYNSSIRIQGLDGKYTQLLRDGLPLYSGFSGGLSLMQIAPLDLKQVEVIKGSSSTLYGGGAIAGLVNLVSKTPEEEPELSFMLNGTSALGLDASGFYSKKFEKVGTTVFASYNKGTPYDPADIGLTAIPKFSRFTFNPKLYFYFDTDTELMVGANYVTENRLGGNMIYAEGNDIGGVYFEENNTDRLSSQLIFTHSFSENTELTIKNSVSYYNREIAIPNYNFAGNQLSSFSEINLVNIKSATEWIYGLNLWTDNFEQTSIAAIQPLDYSNYTFGSFIQNTVDFSDQWHLESGFRADYQSDYGFFPLPRLSLMYEPNNVLTFRLGGGLGYKTPTIFNEDAESLQFRNILPIDVNETEAERSIGGNFDINYRWAITDELTLNTNTLLFYTQIKDPLVLTRNENTYEFLQPNGYVDTKGVEVNMKWSFHDFKLFVGYTFTDVEQHYNDEVTEYPLVAKHRLNNVLMYEKHENFWVGLEAYYYSPQQLNDGTEGQSYWILGLMTEKKFGEHFSLFLNFENFLDTRQTAFDTIYTGSIDNPEFRDIYAPVDGFVVNGGFKLNW